MRKIVGFIAKYAYVLPPLQMAALLYLALFDVSDNVLKKLAEDFGNSTISLICYVALFFNPKLRYCLFTRVIVIGLVLNHLLYKIGSLLAYDTYGDIYTALIAGSSILAWWIILFRNRKNVVLLH